MATNVEVFEQHLLQAPVYDPVTFHHQFVNGHHGRKLDLDNIPDESVFFQEWVDVNVTAVKDLTLASRDSGKLALVSVAKGTDRLVGPVAEALGDWAFPILTVRTAIDSVGLNETAIQKIEEEDPSELIVLEDVGTTGGMASTAVLALWGVSRVNKEDVTVLNTYVRVERLPRLLAINAKHKAIIHHPLPTYTPDECRKIGFCSQNSRLIPYKRADYKENS